MNLHLTSLALLMFVISTVCGVASKTKASELWVDASSVRDGDGSVAKPFTSIQAASREAIAGDTIRVQPGVYRERVMPERGGEPGRPIIYQSEVLHGAVVTGSDVWSPVWRDEGHGIYSGELDPALFKDNGYVDGGNPFRIAYNWDQKRNRPPYPFAGVNWTLGQVFADGKTLKETSSRTEITVTSGSWWYDSKANRIVVNLGGKDPRNLRIEITTRRGVFRPLKKGLGYIEVRGFVFEHCANQFPGKFWENSNYAESGMVGTRSGNHWVIADNIFRDAKSIGLTFGTSGGIGEFDNELPAQIEPHASLVGFHIITGNVFEANGAVGAMGCNTHGVQFSGNLFTANNALLNTSYETGGIKTHGAFGLHVEGNWFADNECEGIWLDNTWKNCLIARNIFLGNRGKNVFFEMDDNDAKTPSEVCDNVFLLGRPPLRPVGSQPAPPWSVWPVGIYGHDASGVRIEHNFFAGDGCGVFFRKMDDRKGGAGRISMNANFFAGRGLNAVCLPIDNPPNVRDNLSDFNIFPSFPRPFAATGWSLPKGVVDRKGVEKIFHRATAAGGEVVCLGKSNTPPPGYELSFDQWRKVMNFDHHSVAADIGWELDRKNWRINLTIPELPLLGKHPNESLVETDFLGRPFSDSVEAGCFGYVKSGVNSIQLPAPPFYDEPKIVR